ncbi:MAG: cold shock domain-containing protein [Cryomorphaceae bacterium]|jgi:cold shock CspA family protein|nr:cold shock domain-containing protein [Cryomorphaceae bacterium]
MGRSQETFSKKDKEKNKIKKRQDKLLKKEERKANSKGGGLENMMAYIDENGNITDTPVDLSARKKVDAESIDITIPKRTEEPEEKTRQGKVTHFNESKGYGFIKDLETQETVFVHINGVLGTITENDMVTFEKVRGPKGWNAVHVKPAK